MWTRTVLELQIHSRMDAEFILCESVTMKASKGGQPKKRADVLSVLFMTATGRELYQPTWWISTKAWLLVYIALVDV